MYCELKLTYGIAPSTAPDSDAGACCADCCMKCPMCSRRNWLVRNGIPDKRSRRPLFVRFFLEEASRDGNGLAPLPSVCVCV